MAQLTIYIDAQTQAKAKEAARKAKRSLSSWACEQLRKAAEEGESWPFDKTELYGSIGDPTFVRPEQPGHVHDSEREQL